MYTSIYLFYHCFEQRIRDQNLLFSHPWCGTIHSFIWTSNASTGTSHPSACSTRSCNGTSLSFVRPNYVSRRTSR